MKAAIKHYLQNDETFTMYKISNALKNTKILPGSKSLLFGNRTLSANNKAIETKRTARNIFEQDGHKVYHGEEIAQLECFHNHAYSNLHKSEHENALI